MVAVFVAMTEVDDNDEGDSDATLARVRQCLLSFDSESFQFSWYSWTSSALVCIYCILRLTVLSFKKCTFYDAMNAA